MLTNRNALRKFTEIQIAAYQTGNQVEWNETDLEPMLVDKEGGFIMLTSPSNETIKLSRVQAFRLAKTLERLARQ